MSRLRDMYYKMCIRDREKVDVWPELNLMEVVLDSDSLIFQDGRECFVDPLDLEFIEERKIQSIYVVSYEEGDDQKARRVIKEIQMCIRDRTGTMLGEIMNWKNDVWADMIRETGFYLGKFIYLMDAYEDLDKDIKKHRFNPCLLYTSRCV